LLDTATVASISGADTLWTLQHPAAAGWLRGPVWPDADESARAALGVELATRADSAPEVLAD